MNTRLHYFRLRTLPFRLLAAGMTAMIFLGPVMAAERAPAPGADLQSAYEESAHDARLSDDLDPAYELLGIAETAHMQNFPQIAAKAATAFADLVKRATIKALKTGGTMAEDTLDQFVDLRFVARSANLPLPQAALDEAMTSLFPTVSTALQRKIDDAGTWDDKLKYATDLGDLQASATQILKDDVARELGEAFDRKTAVLETQAAQETDEAARTLMQEGLARARKSREDRVADATANNINVVAALLQNQTDKSFEGGGRQRGDMIEIPEDLAAGVGSCIETGFTGKSDPAVMRDLELNCINSGRVPAQGRCPTANLSFLCYGATPSAEKMTYVYRGTPDELYFQHKCSPENVVRGDQVPPTGAAFRRSNVALAFTCAPSGAE
jgi:hypothetical protein